MSRQNYYAQRQERQRRKVDEELVEALVEQERALQPRIGTRKLHRMLQGAFKKAGIKIGRDRLFEILAARGLLVKRRRSPWPRTTKSRHCLPVFKNEIKGRQINGPNQVWVSDLTYLRTEQGYLFLSLITDQWSRKVVGYNAGDTLEAVGCIAALEDALAGLPAEARPIHHSDRGTQYCSHEYVDRLRARGLGISMTEINHCAENAMAERMNGILKDEYGLDQEFKTKEQALRAVDQGVLLYNTRRPHTSLDYQIPEQVHTLAV